jgi:nitrate reductase alpha subunit
MLTAKQAAETILMLAPETNGETAVKAWVGLEKRTGLSLQHLSLRRQGERIRFDDLTAQPRKIITSPVWSGIESEERRYSPFVINIEEKIPFRTLTGRAQFYLDHPWMLDFGEHLPLYRPPLDMLNADSIQVQQF